MPEQPNWQPFGDSRGSYPNGSDLFGAVVPRYFRCI